MSFASLSSGLLARKGQARPAMRPQGFEQLPSAVTGQDDLGWNDMGHDRAPAPALTPLPVPSTPAAEPAATLSEPAAEPDAGEAEPAAASAGAEVVRLPVVRAAPGTKGKSAFTLRLDPVRHLRLRLACALRHRSAQTVVTEALDLFLASPELDALADQATRSDPHGSATK